MSAGNGSIPIIGHRPAMKKDSDLITVRECRALIADETSKVHEYYLNQLPPYIARMIQDALLSFGLIKLSEEATDNLSKVEPPAPDVPPSDGDEMSAVNPS